MSAKTPKPYFVEYANMLAVVWASSAGKARYAAAISLADSGWMRRADPSKVSCRRAPKFDHLTTAKVSWCYSIEHMPTA